MWLHAAYLSNCISVVESRQQDSFLTSAPVEFSAFIFEYRISGTLVSVTGIDDRDFNLSSTGVVDHGYDGDAQRFT